MAYSSQNLTKTAPFTIDPLIEIQNISDFDHNRSFQKFFDVFFSQTSLEDTLVNRSVAKLLYEGVTGCRNWQELMLEAQTLFLPDLANKGLSSKAKSAIAMREVLKIKNELFLFLKMPSIES